MTWRVRLALGFLALALLLGGCSAPPPIPRSLGGLPLTGALQGEEVLREVGRLHGKRILARDGFVAHYGQEGTAAVLYVSTAYVGPLARWQLSRMVRAIKRAQSSAKGPFYHLKTGEEGGLTLYSALGLGQIHYFYRSGTAIVWLAVDLTVARAALADTLRIVR